MYSEEDCGETQTDERNGIPKIEWTKIRRTINEKHNLKLLRMRRFHCP